MSPRALAAGLALLGLGCVRGDPPSVVIVLVDQLRKDFADQLMVGINAAAGRGIAVDGMRAASPWTYPSVVSLMSGLHPHQHGADGHLRERRLSGIDPGVPLLPQRLREAGYATAAFVTNPFLLDWNRFHDGFDHFDGSFVRSQGNHWGDLGVWLPDRMFAGSVNAAVRRHFDATPLNGPEFSYVHYIDVHGPWDGAPFAPAYDEAVLYVDAKVMELYAYLSSRYGENLIFVVTSDHGCALRDDREIGYGPDWRKQKHSVHDYNLRVPFAVLASDVVPEAVRVAGPSSHVDVVPTLLDWLGLESGIALPGRSLLPAIRAERPLPDDRPIYARNTAFGAWNDGVVFRGRKFVRFFDPETGEVALRRVFDLAGDPRETRSLADRFGAAEALFAGIAAAAPRFETRFDDIEPDIEAPLRALGYLEAVKSPGESRPP